jgi:S-layer protein (TIGR01564 family)
MISKCFQDWINQHPDIENNKWSDFLAIGYADKTAMADLLTDTIQAWHHIKDKETFENHFYDNHDSGFAVVDQAGELAIVHHPIFSDTGRIFGYTTNCITDNPIEVRLDEEFMTTISPAFDIDWNTIKARMDESKIDDNSIDINDTDNNEHVYR